MKTLHEAQPPDVRDALEQRLYEAILTLRTPKECRQFFRDLTTPAEREALADRWAVVDLLQDGMPYREIHDVTGVSVTTVGRVARCLIDGNGGYELACRRLADRDTARSGA